MSSYFWEKINQATQEGKAELIYQRLAGAEFDVPPNKSLGELPYQYFIDLLSDQNTPASFQRELVGATILLLNQAIDSLSRSSSEEITWILALLRLVGELESSCFSEPLTKLVTAASTHDSNESVIRGIMLESLRLTSSLDSENARSIRSQILDRSALCQSGAEVIADGEPIALFEYKAEHHNQYLTTHVLKQNDWDHLTEVIRLASSRAKAIYGKRKFSKFLGLMSEAALVWARDEKVNLKVRRAYMRGLSLANFSSEAIRKIEESFWEHLQPDYGGINKYYLERQALSQNIRRWLNKPAENLRDFQGPLRWNNLPFAENAYIRVFQLLVESFYGVDVEIDTRTHFEAVGEKLAESGLTVAIHNQSLEAHYQSLSTSALYRSATPLFVFRNYEIICSRDRLRRALRENHLSTDGKVLARQVLKRGFTNIEASQFDELKNLLAECKVVVCRSTDMEDALVIFFKQLGIDIDDDWLIDAQPDEGAAVLLDGDAGFQVGGALQSHYLKNTFPERVMSAEIIGGVLEEHMYVSEAIYEKSPDFFNQLLAIWSLVERVWRMVKAENMGPQGIRPLIEALRKDAVCAINKDSANRMGFVESLEDLESVLNLHDKLMKLPGKEISRKCQFIPVRRDSNVAKLSSVGE